MTAVPDKAQKASSPFWQFSLKFYAMPEVAPACLRLQDEAGVDVNLLFFLLWYAAQGFRLSEAELRDIDRAIDSWRSTAVIPLREIRRALKTAPTPFDRGTAETFRNRIKAAELEAERLEQEALYAMARTGRYGTSCVAPLEAAQASLAAYESLLRPFPRAPLDVLLAAFARQLNND